MVLLRRVIGDALRARRQAQHRTLREVSTAANVSLGYLSEVERGQKEPSSELLSAICEALGAQLSELLRDVSYTVEHVERGTHIERGTVERGTVERGTVERGTAVPTQPAVPAGVASQGAPAERGATELVPADGSTPESPVPAAAARLAAPGRAARPTPVAKATTPRPVLTSSTTVDGDVAVTVRQDGPLRTTLLSTRTNRRPTDRGPDALLPV